MTPIYPRLTAVHPSFRRHVPERQRGPSASPMHRSLQRYLQDPEFLPAQCIRLGDHCAAPVLEIPVKLTARAVPSRAKHPCLRHVDSQVFIKHRNYAQIFNALNPFMGEQDAYNTIDSHIVDSYIATKPHDDSLLTVAVVERHNGSVPTLQSSSKANLIEFSKAAIRFTGVNVPLSITVLAVHGILSIHYIHERSALQFVFHKVSDVTTGRTSSRLSKSISNFLSWLRNRRGENLITPSPKFDRDWVFDAVRRTSRDNDTDSWRRYIDRVRNVDSLHVSLRGYQVRAVAWMLSRELDDPIPLFGDKGVAWPETTKLAKFFAINRKNVKVVDKFAFYSPTLDIWFGAEDDQRKSGIKIGSGGLLCDEMGLGKTVELMQLVLCNQSPRRGSVDTPTPAVKRCRECGRGHGSFVNRSCAECGGYFHMACLSAPLKLQRCFLCSKCIRRMSELCLESTPASALPESRATLVIVPSALLLQWEGELEKHVKESLNIVKFLGLRRSGYIPQKTLQEADVVLSTYDALKSDVTTVLALRNPRANMRHEKQYFPTPVPLLLIKWHRVALDESQMLGSSSNNSTLKMARFLHAKHRWCVTGTPIADDLKGSLAMISVLCSTDGSTMPWEKLCSPTVYIEDRQWVALTLRSIMWRTMKIDVENGELNLPPQIVEVVRTRFGPIERYHYRSLQREILLFRAARQNRNAGFVAYSREVLTTLRQACCHPNIGASGRRLLMSHATRSHAAKRRENIDQENDKAENPMSMSQVLSSLISKSQTDCQESLRNCIAALNGLAGIRLLQATVQEAWELKAAPVVSAITVYREGLSLASSMEHLVKIDIIQRMHILFNLAQALEQAGFLIAKLLSKPVRTDLERREIQRLQSLGRSTQESSLHEDFSNLRKSYIRDAETTLKTVTEQLRSKTSDLGSSPLIHDIKEEPELCRHDADGTVESSGGSTSHGWFKIQWWERALAIIKDQRRAERLQQVEENEVDDIAKEDSKVLMGEGELFVHGVLDALESNRKNVNRSRSRLYNRLGNFKNFALVIENEIRSLMESRRALIAKLKVLPGGRPPTDAEVAESGQCSECRDAMRGPPCSHCLAEELIQDVEDRLYSVSDVSVYLDDSASFDPSPLPNRSSRAAAVQSAMVGALRPSPRIRHSSGARMTGELEIVLRRLSSAALRIDRSTGLKEEVAKWMEKLQKVKDEFASAKVVLEAQRALLAVMDELKMAQTRLTLVPASSVSNLSETERRYHVTTSEVGTLAGQFEWERNKMFKEMKDKKGRLSYLLSLQNNMEGSSGKRARDEFEEMCAICYTSFIEVGRLGVFACAHLFCGECTEALIKKRVSQNSVNQSAKIACPTCRHECTVAEISFTNIGPGTCSKKQRRDTGSSKIGAGPSHGTEDEPDSSNALEGSNNDNSISRENDVSPLERDIPNCASSAVAVQNRRRTQGLPRAELSSTFIDRDRDVNGSNGCKTAMLIRLLSGIWKKGRDAKVVVFSEWEQVLELIRHALEANCVQFFDGSTAGSRNSFSLTVEEFKRCSVGACLLLPLRKAAAGLNLTEATHVILVEPSMDIRLEKQAIGRVHRIGQTQVTYVHHLIVEGTVEELILKRGDRWRQVGAGARHDTTEVFDDSLDGPEQLMNEAIGGELLEFSVAEDVEASVPVMGLSNDVIDLSNDAEAPRQ